MAGRDTVAAQLYYGMHHLATNPADRERLLAHTSLMPAAVEAVLRLFPIVPTARKVNPDTDIPGSPTRNAHMRVFQHGPVKHHEQAFTDHAGIHHTRRPTTPPTTPA